MNRYFLFFFKNLVVVVIFIIIANFFISCGGSPKKSVKKQKENQISLEEKFSKEIKTEEKISTNVELIKKLKISINKDTFTASAICGKCHVAIFNKWKNSLHSASLTDPIFDAAYMQAIKLNGESARQLCLRCHSPIAIHNKDYFLSKEISNDGVSCDYCHSISSIDNKTLLYKVIPGINKYGTIAKAISPVHKTQYNGLFTKSDFCKGCHEFINKNGIVVFGTFSEWQTGKYAKEKQCQDCHMLITNGEIVRNDIKHAKYKINLHDIQGGHSVEQLQKAAVVKVENVTKEKNKFVITVGITNKGSGHMIPTGIPTRKLVLNLVVRDKNGNKLFEDEMLFNKLVAGSDGKILESDAEIILKGAKIVKDNRIAPGENRKVYFNFYSTKDNFIIEAKLSYKYNPVSLTTQEIFIEMSSDKKKYK